jgi:alpha-glucosidase
LPLPLSFLGRGAWKVTLWQDAPDSDVNAEHLVKVEKTVRSTDTLHLELAPSGGMVAIFSPAAATP